ALSVTPLEGGRWRIGIHIAAPALALAHDSPLDLLARERMSSVYMPGDKITMLPDPVVARYSLDAGREVAALSLYLDVSADGSDIEASHSRIERVPIAANLRHEQVSAQVTEAALASDDAARDLHFGPALRVLWRVTLASVARRERMRGKPKAPIRLTIVRKGESKPFEVTLIRDVIRVQSVKSKMIEPGYGWVRVSQFQEHTGETMARHITQLYKDGPLKGLILDLRNDPGGLLNGAVGISAAFLPAKALVVSTDGRTEDARRKFVAAPEDYLRGSREDYLKGLPAAVKTVPMVVLVNGGSASASEIVAGALQDHKRATIIGTQTFGKGSVQTIMPLGNSTAIKLTTARYYTPLGRSIQAKGIIPDIVVEDPSSPSARIREADLAKHLDNDKDKSGAAAQ
ncbi:MAG: RNB domain-containing ribonuclease, partial [Gammaproteobacteria bacterium]|nr:RNB domain-containing ribonuclease [Gammaproteobacteria bacterium]